jgi:RNA 2',3'-cyclic 3'-phosphodiesterase
MPRLFTGLAIPADVGDHLALTRGGLEGAHWIEAADYHVTLRFIGDVDGYVAQDIHDALLGIRRHPVTVTLDGLAAFGGDKPRALVAHVRPDAALIEMQAEQERLMRRLGLPAETRRFTPHVTLARLRRTPAHAVADFLAQRGFFPPRTFLADRFALFSARESVGGGPYLVEGSYPLV